MYTISDVAAGNVEAKQQVAQELSRLMSTQLHNAHSSLHQAIGLIWLLPETPEREALRKGLYKITDEYFKLLNEELEAYNSKSK